MINNIATKVNIHAIWRIYIKFGGVHAIIAWTHTLCAISPRGALALRAAHRAAEKLETNTGGK